MRDVFEGEVSVRDKRAAGVSKTGSHERLARSGSEKI